MISNGYLRESEYIFKNSKIKKTESTVIRTNEKEILRFLEHMHGSYIILMDTADISHKFVCRDIENFDSLIIKL